MSDWSQNVVKNVDKIEFRTWCSCSDASIVYGRGVSDWLSKEEIKELLAVGFVKVTTNGTHWVIVELV